MSVDNALAGVAVGNLGVAAERYEQLIGHPGKQPMRGVPEWTLPRGGVLEIFDDPKRAGASSVTFSVKDLDDHVARLCGRGIKIQSGDASGKVSTVMVSDLDGNQVVLAEQHSDHIAR